MRPAVGLLPFQHNELEFSATRMSALGHWRTLKRLHPMSALPPKADITERDWNVCFVPKADIDVLLRAHGGTAEVAATA